MDDCAKCSTSASCSCSFAECCSDVAVSKVKIEDGGKSAVFINDGADRYVKILVDGCLIKDGLRADWLVWRHGVGQVIVELKGRDIAHAVKQVCATAQYMKDNALRDGRVAALIVCKQVPSGSTQTQKAQQNFMRQYGGHLSVKSGSREYVFDQLLCGQA